MKSKNLFLISVLIIVIIISITGCKKQKLETGPTDNNQQTTNNQDQQITNNQQQNTQQQDQTTQLEYTHHKGDSFSMKYPKDWRIEVYTPDHIQIFSQPSSATFYVEVLETFESFDQVVSRKDGQFEGSNKLEKEIITFSGAKAYKISYVNVFQINHIYALKEGKLYWIMHTTKNKVHEPTIQEMLDSFIIK